RCTSVCAPTTSFSRPSFFRLDHLFLASLLFQRKVTAVRGNSGLLFAFVVFVVLVEIEKLLRRRLSVSFAEVVVTGSAFTHDLLVPFVCRRPTGFHRGLRIGERVETRLGNRLQSCISEDTEQLAHDAHGDDTAGDCNPALPNGLAVVMMLCHGGISFL